MATKESKEIKEAKSAKSVNADKNNVAEAQVIAVDIRKLSQGLKTTFEGVALVFDSIGCGSEFASIVGTSENTMTPVDATDADVVKDEVKAEAKAEKEPEKAVEPVEESEPVQADEHTDEVSKHNDEAASDDTSKEAAKDASKGASAVNAADPAVSVTVDDITKVIVQKIKQNRSNNEKIGAILKAYGVSKVGELPATKYEAFLTDLAAV